MIEVIDPAAAGAVLDIEERTRLPSSTTSRRPSKVASRQRGEIGADMLAAAADSGATSPPVIDRSGQRVGQICSSLLTREPSPSGVTV
jgi:hypothetical protein